MDGTKYRGSCDFLILILGDGRGRAGGGARLGCYELRMVLLVVALHHLFIRGAQELILHFLLVGLQLREESAGGKGTWTFTRRAAVWGPGCCLMRSTLSVLCCAEAFDGCMGRGGVVRSDNLRYAHRGVRCG